MGQGCAEDGRGEWEQACKLSCVGQIKPMSATLRVATAVFKSNMRPFVDEAKAGKNVIVTNDGEDDFRVLPIHHTGPPAVSEPPLSAELYKGIDVNTPAFESWNERAH